MMIRHAEMDTTPLQENVVAILAQIRSVYMIQGPEPVLANMQDQTILMSAY